ncbi:MAG: hypothetical protein JWN70_32 [Planctomycetaceae bacterium]|nr:hypothetical protein [Planctomycetaceae bacterium]
MLPHLYQGAGGNGKGRSVVGRVSDPSECRNVRIEKGSAFRKSAQRKPRPQYGFLVWEDWLGREESRRRDDEVCEGLLSVESVVTGSDGSETHPTVSSSGLDVQDFQHLVEVRHLQDVDDVFGRIVDLNLDAVVS